MMRQLPKISLILSLAVLLTVSCKKETNTDTSAMQNIHNQEQEFLNHLDKKKMDVLSSKKIFFGHRSVGANIMDGISLAKAFLSIEKLNIVETRDLSEIRFEGYFAHAGNGENRLPKSKVDAFVQLIEDTSSVALDIAFFKFCYADFQSDTDIEDVFQYYVTNMERLIKENPEIKFIHCTAPVRTRNSFSKRIVHKLTGNKKASNRQEFNKLMRNKYTDGTLFDLAYYESITNLNISDDPSGRGDYLLKEYTTDGGHLNSKGKVWIAYNLLTFLGEIDSN